MNVIDSPLIGKVLLHFVWQGAVIALILALALSCLGRASAKVRYLVLCLGMTIMMAAPILTAFDLATDQLSTTVLKEPATFAALGPISESPVLEPEKGLAPVMVGMWLAGVALIGAWRLLGWVRIVRLSLPCNLEGVPDRLAALMNQLRSELRIRSKVILAYSQHIQIPCVIGAWRPKILLPSAILSTLNEAQFKAILMHELMHIKRHDYLVNLLQTVVETVLFYHPAVWWVGRRLRAERENCCDDGALLACEKASVYGEALLRLEEHRMEKHLLEISAGDRLVQRIRRIFHPGQRSEISLARASLGLAGAMIAICCGLWMISQNSSHAEEPGETKPEIARGEVRDSELVRLKELTDKLNSLRRALQSKDDFTEIEKRLKSLERLAGNQLFRSAAMETEDPVINGLWTAHQEYLSKRKATLDAGLGKNHPRIKELDGRISRTTEILEAEVINVKKTLAMKLKAAEEASRQIDATNAGAVGEKPVTDVNAAIDELDAVIAEVVELSEKQARVRGVGLGFTPDDREFSDLQLKVPGEITILGEVENPKKVEWFQGMTLSQAIESANGFTEWALPAGSRLVRDGHSELIDLSDEQQLRRPLRAGDRIIVIHR